MLSHRDGSVARPWADLFSSWVYCCDRSCLGGSWLTGIKKQKCPTEQKALPGTAIATQRWLSWACEWKFSTQALWLHCFQFVLPFPRASSGPVCKGSNSMRGKDASSQGVSMNPVRIEILVLRTEKKTPGNITMAGFNAPDHRHWATDGGNSGGSGDIYSSFSILAKIIPTKHLFYSAGGGGTVASHSAVPMVCPKASRTWELLTATFRPLSRVTRPFLTSTESPLPPYGDGLFTSSPLVTEHQKSTSERVAQFFQWPLALPFHICLTAHNSFEHLSFFRDFFFFSHFGCFFAATCGDFPHWKFCWFWCWT